MRYQKQLIEIMETTINLGGTIFKINDEAKLELDNYLSGFINHYGESSEVIEDMKLRIAELLSERVGKKESLVTVDDIRRIIDTIGTLEQILEIESESQFENESNKKVYRNPDDKVFGGVASGLAAYFGLAVVTVRVMFIFLLLIGVGAPIYIFLWLLIPKAETSADKASMQGEEFRFSTLKERFQSLKNDDSFSGIGSKARSIKNKVEKPIRSFIDRFSTMIGLGILFLTLFSVAVLFIFVFGDTGILPLYGDRMPYTFQDIISILFHSEIEANIMLVGISFFLILPLIGMIWLGFKFIFNMKGNVIKLVMTLSIVWTFSFVICVVMSIKVGREFMSWSVTEEVHTMNKVTGNNVYLTLRDDDLFSNSINYNHLWSIELLKVKGDELVLGYPRLKIVENESSESYELVVSRSAYGISEQEAIERAEKIQFDIKEGENILELSPYFQMDKTDSWRCQNILVTLKVPAGKTVTLDSKIKRIFPEYRSEAESKSYVSL